MKSTAFDRFLCYFELTGKERLDGLDSTYFEQMSEEERLEAFEILKQKMNNGSEEAIKGLNLISEKKAYPELKKQYDLIKGNDRPNRQLLTLAYHLYLYDNDVQYQTAMASFLFHEDKYLRLAALSFLGHTKISNQKVEMLEKAVLSDQDKTVLYVVAEQLLEGYGILEDDPATGDLFEKNIDRFLSADFNMRRSALAWLKENYSPRIVV